jgi:hypothetical protein
MPSVNRSSVFINGGKTLAVFFSFGPDRLRVGRSHLCYEVRAGKKGTGRVLAKANCVFLCSSQENAMQRLSKQVGGLEFVADDNSNLAKFEAAGAEYLD